MLIRGLRHPQRRRPRLDPRPPPPPRPEYHKQCFSRQAGPRRPRAKGQPHTPHAASHGHPRTAPAGMTRSVSLLSASPLSGVTGRGLDLARTAAIIQPQPGNVPGGLSLRCRRTPGGWPTRGRNPGGPDPDLLAGGFHPSDPDVTDADLAGECGGPPDDRPGCFGRSLGIAGLALERDGGLIQLVPACSRPDQAAPAGKR